MIRAALHLPTWVWGFVLAAFGVFVLICLMLGTWWEIGRLSEQNFSPPVGSHHIVEGSVHRTTMALCWTWEADHYREARAVEWDFHMTNHRGYTDTFIPFRDADGPNPEDLRTGSLPQVNESVKAGEHIQTSYCAPLSRLIKPTDVVTVYGRVRITGFLGLWTVWHQLPTFSSEPM